ncbi:PREDICTED: uncharacterized protein LOC109163870 [Ipomoea nil]|uniref:uncharacterized protein LOC109163870 n=1 Tax=Ipomoea nil TaxID=35883 RepID=UPI0009010301|nr:PREDICTED: uncharacterized protein LOC109163870 [Ipomoea nil]
MLKGATETRKKTSWSTWEELLLAFAVKRHGLKDWDSVAMELQNRCSIPAVITAQICKDKYHDLHRRFMNNDAAADGDAEAGRVGGGVGDAIAIPWLEELRQLRVAELKQEVHRYDLSIQSLQLKVKRLEEREQSSKDVSVEPPDLEDDGKEQRSENDENNGGRETTSGKDVSFSCKDSDRENRSFNESNSTENRRTGEKLEPDSVPIKPDPEAKPVWEEDSCNDSSDRHKASKLKTDSELRDSVSESKEGTKDSSDVQSSASLTERRRKRTNSVGGRVTTAAASPSPPAISTKRGGAVKPEALVGLLDIIRSHKHGQVFQRRLDSQKTEDYKKAIRRHVDLETVQARIDDGSYSSCSTRFYLDLLLLFNNAIVFFPKSSPESTAAFQLRDIAVKELKKKKEKEKNQTPSPEPVQQPKLELERSDSLLAKHKSTAPIVVCRKRSSISGGKTATSGNKQGKVSDEKAKPKPPLSQKLSSSSNLDEDEDDSSTKLKMKEKPVTGVRSTRRSSKGNPPKEEVAKTDKEEVITTTTDKKRGAADFLKRMKKDSQGTVAAAVSVKNSSDDAKPSSRRREQQKRKQQQATEERKDGPVRRSSGGAGGRKEAAAAEESSLSKRNVGRPPKRGRDAAAATPEKRGKETSVDKEESSKRPKKRTRR